MPTTSTDRASRAGTPDRRTTDSGSAQAPISDTSNKPIVSAKGGDHARTAKVASSTITSTAKKTTALVSQVAPQARFMAVTERVSSRRNASPKRNISPSMPRPVTLRRRSGEAAKAPARARAATAAIIER